MSKTVDDLHETYCLAVKAYMNSNGGALIWDAERAGIAAIVRAMRDECDPDKFPRAGYMCWGDFNEILGPAGDEVADTPDLPTRTVQLTGITKSARPDVQFEPATAPAPAVCEWVLQAQSFRHSEYQGCQQTWRIHREHNGPTSCPECKAPIKFTEAK